MAFDRRVTRAGLAALVLVLALGAGAMATARPDRGRALVVVAAGDIAGTSTSGAWVDTAALIGSIKPNIVIPLGDDQYPNGALADYQAYYGSAWGAYFSRTWPTPGNHEYLTPNAQGYFDYFGTRARGGYYSYDLGGWHLISLNSEIDHGAGSVQEQWLAADLAATTKPCILAYWHRPRWSSGDTSGSDPSVGPFVTDLYNARADLILVGHEHNYERFDKQDPDGNAVPDGIREIVAGTGGFVHFSFGPAIPNSQVRDSTSFGVLKLTLYTRGYDLEFVPATGTFTDQLTRVACN